MSGYKIDETKIYKIFSYILLCLMVIAILTGAFSFVLKGFGSTPYTFIWLWPSSYFIFLFVIYNLKHRIGSDHWILLGSLLIMMTERYIVYPFLVSMTSDDYMGIRHYSMDNSIISYGTAIGIIECLGLAFFVFLFEGRSYKKGYTTISLHLSGSKCVYIIFILIAILTWIFVGRQYHVVQFLQAEYRFTEVMQNKYLILAKYIISSGITLFVLMGLSFCKKQYMSGGRTRYFLYALFFAMLRICVIEGESRGTQIALAMLMLLLLVQDYPNKIFTIVAMVFVGTVIIVSSVTLLRTNTTSLGMESIVSVAQKMQIYIGGIDSLAQSVDLFNTKAEVHLENYIFDFLRSVFPFSLVLKEYGYTINQIYNLTLYEGAHPHGHIVFGASYGTILFGIIGAPLNICISYWLAAKLNELFSHAATYEGKYIAGFCLLRVLAAMFSNLPTILGSVTQFLGTFGLVVFVSHLAKRGLSKKVVNC